ncbi:MAG: GNAT family N-acetyltransferase [Polyangia bacterium]
MEPRAEPREPQVWPRSQFTVPVSEAGIITLGTETLTIVPEPPTVGRAVCVSSGGRLAFRRVLGVDGQRLWLRADVAPFEDAWEGDIVGCVKPRPIDRLVALAPELWTRTSWRAAVAVARALEARSRVGHRRAVRYSTRLLELSEWSLVRDFWRRACGKTLEVRPHPRQHVVGLFDDGVLVGANIHLVLGASSYSAFTLVDRRYRGTGGGSRMLRTSIEVARAQGLDGIYVHIDVRNLPSLAAYERVGFVRKGWWADDADPLLSAERQWIVLEIELRRAPPPLACRSSGTNSAATGTVGRPARVAREAPPTMLPDLATTMATARSLPSPPRRRRNSTPRRVVPEGCDKATTSLLVVM